LTQNFSVVFISKFHFILQCWFIKCIVFYVFQLCIRVLLCGHSGLTSHNMPPPGLQVVTRYTYTSYTHLDPLLTRCWPTSTANQSSLVTLTCDLLTLKEVSPIFPTPVYLTPPLNGLPLEFGIGARGPEYCYDGATRWSKKF